MWPWGFRRAGTRQQFLARYVFFTDPTYGTTSVVLTRAKDKSGFADVTLDCIGTISGWTT
jgi:IgGFc binding protein